MNNASKRTLSYFLCLVGVTFLLNLACSKDVETLRETVINKEVTPVVDQKKTSDSKQDSLEVEVEVPQIKDSTVVETEIRRFVFYPINDAYLQNGKGYNEPIIRLEEQRRTSYLMFDFSPIDSIGGTINTVTLMFTINTDDGNGEVDVYKGDSSSWSETNLSEKSAPKKGNLLGGAKQEYRIGAEVSIELEVKELHLEPVTFILDHKDGDDLAFASKEHKSQAGSSLVIEYEVPVGADDIDLFMVSPEEIEDDNEDLDNRDEDGNTVEEVPVEAPDEDGGDTSDDNDPISEEEEDNRSEDVDTPEEDSSEVSEKDSDEDATTEEDKGEDTTDPNIDALPKTPFPKNESPVAVADGSPVNGQAPLKVSFSGVNSSDDKAIVSYKWSLEEGHTGNTAEVEHTFLKAGSYEVTLVVKDEEGITTSDVVIITVEESTKNVGPVAKLSANKTSGTVPLTVNFTGSNSTDDMGVTGYSWDFKDGNSSDKSNPSHTFESEGTYEVELTVTDVDGLENKETVSITVDSKENGAPIAKLNANKTSGTVPLTVNFTGSDSTDDTGVTGYSWDFKDGNSSDKSDPSHTFESAGTYEVELTVTDADGLENKETVSITVDSKENDAPVAKLSANKTSGTVPLTVNFTGSDSTDDTGVTGYSWDFKDGNSSDKSNPSHTFESAGIYEVELTVTDADGLENKETVSIEVNVPANQPPTAKVRASTQSGQAPLAINFTGSNSTDDVGVTAYMWDFKDGSTSNKSNPSHTFNSAGTYEVELTVADVNGLQDKETITINVEEVINNPPVAVARANTLSGEAPLAVNFIGNDSSDDKGITRYEWNISGKYSTEVNPSHVFTTPGVYDVSLTVTDAEGLTNTSSLTVSVTEAISVGPLDCSTGGKKAGETGEKVWCWNNIDIPSYSGGNGVAFSNGELHIDSECSERQVTKSGNRIRFKVDPTVPETKSWCSRDYNLRAEIRTGPWDVRHQSGTEEWFGWSYTFGNNYIIDKDSQWKFFQVHNGIVGKAPQIGLEIIHDNQFIGHEGGEIYVTNAAGGEKFNPTGIVPRAGQTIDVVVHVIWGNSSNGLLEVWIDGKKVYDQRVSTMLSGYPWAGNAKWGIYKWPWANSENVQSSKNQGIGYLETFMGDLRIITRNPGDNNYGVDSYEKVAPN